MFPATEGFWQTKAKNVISIADLADVHLQYAISMVLRNLKKGHYQRVGVRVTTSEATTKLEELLVEARRRERLQLNRAATHDWSFDE